MGDRRFALLVTFDAHMQMRQAVRNGVGHFEHLRNSELVSRQVVVERPVLMVGCDQPELSANTVVFWYVESDIKRYGEIHKLEEMRIRALRTLEPTEIIGRYEA